MKKAIKLFSILALLLCVVSCQISGIDNGVLNDGFKVTAVIDNSSATRVSYAVDNTAYTITPTWSVGDKIIGFDDQGVTFNFTVASLDGDKAVLNVADYVPGTATKLYAIYAPGYDKANFSEGTLTVSLNPQTGELNDESLVYMSATAAIEGGSVCLSFTKETAILGLKKFKLPVAAATTITSMDIIGVPAEGVFSVKEGALVFEPAATVGSVSLKGNWTTDAEGVCETPIYISVAPKAAADVVINMSTGSEHFVNVTSISDLDIEAGYYYHMSKVLGNPVVQIGDSCFGSLEEAFALASTVGGTPLTIKLLQDCTPATAPVLDNAEGIYTLDLNGKTINTTASTVLTAKDCQLTLTDSSTDDPTAWGTITTAAANTTKYVLYIDGGTLTMVEGNIVSPAYRGVNFTNGGNGTISGGHISTPGGVAVGIGATGGNVDITGNPIIEGSGNVVYYWGGTGTISGGYISNAKTSAVIYAAGTSVVTVTGDCHIKTTNLNPAASTGDATMYVSGGYFSVAIREVYAVDKDGNVYYNIPNPNEAEKDTYLYSLVPAASNTLAATVVSAANVWKHASIMSAGTQADIRSKNTAATTLKIEADLNSAQTFSFAEPHKYMLTVDMNGHKLNSTASPALTAECPITIQDSDENGAIITTGDVAVLGLGDVTINGGAYEATMLAVSVADTCALVINDGYFYGGSEDVARGGETATVTISGGWFKNCPNAAYITEGCAANPVSETHLEKTYNYKVAASSVVATVNGTGYATLSSAANAASNYSGAEEKALLVLQEDLTDAPAVEFANENKTIVFDLNGHTVATADSAFIKCSTVLDIVDNGATKGKITSSALNVICKVGTGTINLKGVVIECTKAASPNFYGSAVVYLNNSSSTVNISDGTKIIATGQVPGVSNRAGTVTITDSEVSSGTVSAGNPAICNGGTSASTTINSGSFFTSATSRSVVVNAAGLASATKAGNIVINGGYFYASDAAIMLKGNYANNDHMAHIFVNGGYFNKTTVWTSSSKQYPPTYGDGLSEHTVDPAETHLHESTGQTYQYGFQVK